LSRIAIVKLDTYGSKQMFFEKRLIVDHSPAANKSEAIESIKRRFCIQNLNKTETDTLHGSSRCSSIVTDDHLIANDRSCMVNINQMGINHSLIDKQKNREDIIYGTCKSITENDHPITQDVNSK
jgi:hypothetical protein